MAVSTSALFFFLVLLVICSLLVCTAERHHHGYRQLRYNRASSSSDDYTELCVRAAQSGGGCHIFSSCCKRKCPSSIISSNCRMNNSGRLSGQCTCGKNAGDGNVENGDNGEGGHGAGDRGEEEVRGQCGRPSVIPNTRGTRIIGSIDATPHSWPWQASLEKRGDHTCGAILLDSTHALTAAHCFERNARTSQFRVVLGLHNQYSPDQSVQSMQVAKIIKHPGYNITMHHTKDIAILKLKSPVNFTTAIQPICLPEDDASVGKKCFVTGWGATQGTGDNTYLLQVSVPIISSSTCNNTEHYGGRIDGTMLCAGRPGRDSCQGDSGGPMVCQRSDGTWELQGIVSWGDGCGLIRRPGIYSRVYTMKTWIEQNTT